MIYRNQGRRRGFKGEGYNFFDPSTFSIPGGYRKQNIAVFHYFNYGVYDYLQQMKLQNSGLCYYYSETETVVRRYCDAGPITRHL